MGRAARERIILNRNHGEAADVFVGSGMGFLMGGPSAQMGRRVLMVGENVTLTPAERRVFTEYKLDRIRMPQQPARNGLRPR